MADEPARLSQQQPSATPDMLQIARWLARQGSHVHPLTAGSKLPVPNCQACHDSSHPADQCPCITAGRPCHGFRAATTDPGRIGAWWQRWPDSNVGVATGASGLTVIDLDSHGATPPERPLPGVDYVTNAERVTNGIDLFGVLCELRGQLWPDTLTVATPTGGRHLWFTASGYRSSAGDERHGLGWSIDVRAAGGYVVAPGSVRPEGVYRRVAGAWPPSPLPAWLGAELARTGHRVNRGQPTGGAWGAAQAAALRAATRQGNRSQRWAAAALATECERIADLRSGASQAVNHQLNRSAFKLGQLVGGGLLGELVVSDALTAAAESTGHDPRHIRATIRSGLVAGQRSPRQVGGAA